MKQVYPLHFIDATKGKVSASTDWHRCRRRSCHSKVAALGTPTPDKVGYDATPPPPPLPPLQETSAVGQEAVSGFQNTVYRSHL